MNMYGQGSRLSSKIRFWTTFFLGLFQKKIPGWGDGGGGGEEGRRYIFLWVLVQKDFKLYGSFVSDQIKLNGWLVFGCMEGAIFVYTQSSNLGCFLRILVKNGTEINSPLVSSVHFTWETCIFRRIYSRKQRYRVVRPLVKANTCKNLYQ